MVDWLVLVLVPYGVVHVHGGGQELAVLDDVTGLEAQAGHQLLDLVLEHAEACSTAQQIITYRRISYHRHAAQHNTTQHKQTYNKRQADTYSDAASAQLG